MEQDKLPCNEPMQPDWEGGDHAVFERVWRRVMPEDRPDCPFHLSGPVPPIPDLPGYPDRQAPSAAYGGQIPEYTDMARPDAAQTVHYPTVCALPAPRPLAKQMDATPSAVESDHCCMENDVPCLGAASAVYSTQLQEFIDHELADWRTYQALSKRAPGGSGKALSAISADERRHAKRLSTAYFLISGVRYWPIERITPMPMGTYQGALRQRFCAEQKGESAYLAAAEDTTDPCLRELYLELAGDENSHAWLLRGILEQL